MKRLFKSIVAALALSMVMALPFASNLVDGFGLAEAEGVQKAYAAEAELNHVTDVVGILGTEETADLESQAQAIQDKWGLGVYIVVVDDYRNFTTADVFDAAMTIYKDYSLGVGPGDDGIMLLLSMSERDYSLIVYGDRASYAFNDEGRALMTDFFLDDFANDDWYAGFADFIEWADLYLVEAEAGTPYSNDNPPMDKGDIMLGIAIRIAAILLIPLILAVVVVSSMLAKMKSVATATRATEYVMGGLNLTARQDVFSHKTEVVERIEEDRGPTTSSSGGFSGTSGKF